MDRSEESRSDPHARRRRGTLTATSAAVSRGSSRERAASGRLRLGLLCATGLLIMAAIAVLSGAGPRAAAARADALADRALLEATPAPETLDRARRALESTGASRPADARRLARLAALEIRRSGALTPRAEALLMRTYVLEPLGPGLTLWRWETVFNHWSESGPALRAAALAEMDAVFGRQGWALQARVPQILDDRGRMVAAMTAQRLRRREALSHAPTSA